MAPTRDGPGIGWRLTGTITAAALALAIAGLALIASAPSSGPEHPVLRISQRNEQFHPGVLVIHRGDTVRVINDDGEVRHHAYVDSPEFKFDSGDQEPGRHSDIRFTIAGHFVVLCAIHPRMRLDVDVR